jgi:ankyrin repeat protein
MEPREPTQEGYARTGFWEKLDVARMGSCTREECMYIACEYDYEHIVDLLLNHGVGELSRGLLTACLHNNMGPAKLLLQNAIKHQSPDFKTDWQVRHVFNTLCRNGHTEVLRMLLETGVEDTEYSGILLACEYGRVDIVKALIPQSTNVILACYDIARRFNRLEVKRSLDEYFALKFNKR